MIKLKPLMQLISIGFSVSAFAGGDPFQPVRSLAELKGSFHQSYFDLGVAHPVLTSRVLIADYELIRKDFTQTRLMSESEIDQWLLGNAAYLSKDQIEYGTSRLVNTDVTYNSYQFKTGIRPPNYGRALVFEVDHGLIEAKGAGGTGPAISRASHRNGLMETAEAIREYAFTKLMKKVLHHADSEFRVIDSYAVLDYGFQLKDPVATGFHPAGALLRQAHFRNFTQPEQIEKMTARKIERLIRGYGITSAYKQSPVPLIGGDLHDLLNIQGSTQEKFLFDFGGYRIAQSFQYPGIVLRDLGKSPAKPVIRAKDLGTLQPLPEYRPLYEAWGLDGEQEKIWQKSREIARAFSRDGKLEPAQASIKDLLQVLETIPDEVKPKRGFSCNRLAVKAILSRKDPPSN